MVNDHLVRDGHGSQVSVDPAIEQARKRTRVIWLVTLFALVAAGVQLFSIQIVRGAELKEQGRIVRTAASSIDGPRGAIVDSSGQTLVDSVQTYHIAVNQQNILEYRHIEDGIIVGTGPAEAARQLAPLLDMDPSELGGLLLGDSTYSYLVKNLDETTARKIRKLGIHGIEWESSYERQYPTENTGLNVLGSISADGNGNAGLELQYDEVLTGTQGEESYEIGPTGAVMPGAKVVTKEASSGATLHLTLDSDLQYAVERDLRESVGTYGASWGSVVVLDVATSKVLALADVSAAAAEGEQTPALSVQMVYEPGSVGKVFTFAAALEAGTIDPTTEFTITDSYVVAGERFTDLGDYGTANRTATGILAQSSNTGTIQIGSTVTDEERHDVLERLGLGSVTGIELPGESAGLLGPSSDWNGRTKYTTMFGQGYALTAIQAAAAAAAIGNGGIYTSPRLVEGWTTTDGVFHQAEPVTPRQALRPEIAKTLISMMESVVQDPDVATGSLADVDGYRVAAKTGSAEIGNGKVAASIIGLVPAEDPQLAISVVLYEVSPGLLASTSAAPLFSEVASDALLSQGIAPSEEPARLFPSSPSS